MTEEGAIDGAVSTVVTPEAQTAAAAPSHTPAPPQPGEFDRLNAEMSADINAWGKNYEGQRRWMELYDAGERRATERAPSGPEAIEPPMHPYALPEEFAAHPDGETFAGVLHAAGIPKDLAGAIFQESFTGEQYPGQDDADRSEVEAELRQVLGDDYEDSVAAARCYLENNLPEGTGHMLMHGARIGGKALFNHVPLVMALIGVAKRAPVVTATGDIAKDIRAIEKVMSSDPDAYQRDSGLHLRLRSLYAKRNKAGR